MQPVQQQVQQPMQPVKQQVQYGTPPPPPKEKQKQQKEQKKQSNAKNSQADAFALCVFQNRVCLRFFSAYLATQYVGLALPRLNPRYAPRAE